MSDCSFHFVWYSLKYYAGSSNYVVAVVVENNELYLPSEDGHL